MKFKSFVKFSGESTSIRIGDIPRDNNNKLTIKWQRLKCIYKETMQRAKRVFDSFFSLSIYLLPWLRYLVYLIRTEWDVIYNRVVIEIKRELIVVHSLPFNSESTRTNTNTNTHLHARDIDPLGSLRVFHILYFLKASLQFYEFWCFLFI